MGEKVSRFTMVNGHCIWFTLFVDCECFSESSDDWVETLVWLLERLLDAVSSDEYMCAGIEIFG